MTLGNVGRQLGMGLIVLGLTACGGKGFGTGSSGGTGTSSGTGGGSTSSTVALGTLNGGTFTPGVIAVGQSPLSAGGSSGLRVDIVDTSTGLLYTGGSVDVSFNSSCLASNTATVTSPVTTATGTANTTYNAQGCSGTDQITASATVNGVALTAIGSIDVQPPQLGSIQFVSAVPGSIGIKGAGTNDNSTVTFKVVDTTGAPAPAQTVDFSLDSTTGSISLSPTFGVSDAQGLVVTHVSSGTIHTTVRVTASLRNPPAGTPIKSQSDGLAVSTGIPDQNSFSLSVATLNIEGQQYDGITDVVTARLADRFNNPVADGTVVSFTAEGGSIQPSCTTTNGACTVTFTSQAPRTAELAAPGTQAFIDNGCTSSSSGVVSHQLGCDDHRYTILATATGEESFSDHNGNGYFDAGEPFGDLGEPFLDANENGVFDAYEDFANGDYNHNGVRDGASGNFTGILCNSGCDPNATALYVYAEGKIVMSSSGAFVNVCGDQNCLTVYKSANPPAAAMPLAVTANTTETFFVQVQDSAGQQMSAGTTIAVSTTIGSIGGQNSATQLDTTDTGPATYLFQISGGSAAGTGQLRIDVTSPKGTVTTYYVPVTVTSPPAP